MKTVFLSMLAIAALAGCTRQEFVDPPAPKGDEMVVELTISSGSLSSKAGTVATPADNTKDKAISDLTVFGVSQAGAIVTKTYFGTPADGTNSGTKTFDFRTTDQTTEIHVIANIGSDLTTGENALNVSSFKDFKNAKVALLVPGSGAAKQTEGNVLMSGFTTSIKGNVGVDEAVTADVSLNFIASKIILKSMTRAAGSKGTYGTNFNFVGAMLTNVQTNAYYFGDGNPLSYIGEIAGGVRTAIKKNFVSGAATAAAGKVTEFYQDLSQTANFDDTHSLSDIAYWYVFENDEIVGTETHPTALQIQYKWKEHDADPTLTKDKYLSIIFGNDQIPAIEAGKVYSITLKIDSDFSTLESGGTGGGGSDNPDKPAASGLIGVTVTPADWGQITDVEKPFQ